VIRETIESIVVAFVLAFLFRTFEAEAFVIPTGSMAPTLMGRHKDLLCPRCSYPYQVSASDEVKSETGEPNGRGAEVVGAICPNCRFPAYIGQDNSQRQDAYPSFKGDRILVSKFAYQIGDPRRWDIAVFRFPGEAKTNYIKRMVGLPGETVRISHGDIWIKGPHDKDFAIARKPPEKMLSMLQPVYDNDYVMPTLIAQGWPARWQPWGKASAAWRTSADYRSFQTDGQGGEAWLRYQHFAPTFQQWQYLGRGEGPGPFPPRAQLITDFTPYNSNRENHNLVDGNLTPPDADVLGLNWVGDLAMDCAVDVRSASGTMLLDLVKGGRHFTCRIDVATGAARLSIDGLDAFHPAGPTPIRRPGLHHVKFSNVDQQLRLGVDGSLITFDGPTTYSEPANVCPDQADLAPVGIGSQGVAIQVQHLRIFRDIYYIAVRSEQGDGRRAITEYDPENSPVRLGSSPDDLAQFFATPSQWDVFRSLHSVEFPLAADQFLVLGDNSDKSLDSRLWEQRGHEYYVKRELLVGKALFIYWPHSWDEIQVGDWHIPFWFFPNFARMRLVR
jgi:signal peptidase I